MQPVSTEGGEYLAKKCVTGKALVGLRSTSLVTCPERFSMSLNEWGLWDEQKKGEFIPSEETWRARILSLPEWKVIEDMTVHFKCSVC